MESYSNSYYNDSNPHQGQNNPYGANTANPSSNSYLTQQQDFPNAISAGQQNTATLPPPVNSGQFATNYNKANLSFEGNMEEAIHNWTQEERENKRRLVQFWRTHTGNNISCSFKPVNPADRVPNSIVVSCILWEEKQEYFITSVDCIYLLEALIAVRFTVEEKNRIRRNLEGFRPLTVSKCKPESSEFFKLIMSFPNPKPRNIEKDVKVFPWKILPYALKKIVGKYTASYSQTQTGQTPDVGFNMSNYSSYAPTPYGYDGRSMSPTHQAAQRRFSQPMAFAGYNRQKVVPNNINQGFMGYGDMNFDNGMMGHRDSNDAYTNQEQMSNYMMNQNQMMSNNSLYPSMLMSPSKKHLSARRHSVADPYSINNFNDQRKGSIPDIQHNQQSQNSSYDNNQYQIPNFNAQQQQGRVLGNTIEEEKTELKFEDPYLGNTIQ